MQHPDDVNAFLRRAIKHQVCFEPMNASDANVRVLRMTGRTLRTDPWTPREESKCLIGRVVKTKRDLETCIPREITRLLVQVAIRQR